MATGDDAIAAGMDVVLGTEDRRQGYDEINRTRDYISEGPNHWKPGLTLDPGKALAARQALGVRSEALTIDTNGAYGIGLVWDSVNLQLFINGVFAGYVELAGPGQGSWAS